MRAEDVLYRVVQGRGKPKNLKKLLKWLIIGGIGVIFLALMGFIVLIFLVISLIIRPLMSSTPDLVNQGQQLWQTGQQELEQRLTQDEAQIQELQQRIEELEAQLEAGQNSESAN